MCSIPDWGSRRPASRCGSSGPTTAAGCRWPPARPMWTVGCGTSWPTTNGTPAPTGWFSTPPPREHAATDAEEVGLPQARRFVDSLPCNAMRRVSFEEYWWQGLGLHSFASAGAGARCAGVRNEGPTAWLVSRVTDLVLLNNND